MQKISSSNDPRPRSPPPPKTVAPSLSRSVATRTASPFRVALRSYARPPGDSPDSRTTCLCSPCSLQEGRQAVSAAAQHPRLAHANSLLPSLESWSVSRSPFRASPSKTPPPSSVSQRARKLSTHSHRLLRVRSSHPCYRRPHASRGDSPRRYRD